MKQKYLLEFRKPEGSIPSERFKETYLPPSRSYLTLVGNSEGSQGQSYHREGAVSDIYRRNQYHLKKMTGATLHGQTDLPSIIQDYVENQLEERSLKDVDRAGIPDFLAYRFERWGKLARKLPPVKAIEMDNNNNEEPILKSKIANSFPQCFIEDIQFVEVKKWDDSLNENQKEWVNLFKDSFDIRIVRVKPVNELTENDIVNIEEDDSAVFGHKLKNLKEEIASNGGSS